MAYDATIYHSDGTSDLIMYRGEPLSTVMEHARAHVEGGVAVRVEVRDKGGALVAQFPRVMRSA